MADPKTKRLKPAVLQADADTLTNLEEVVGYKPANAKYSLANAQAAAAVQVETAAVELKAVAALKTARDNAVAAEQAFHAMALGVRDQVVAQFGQDSNEVQSIGRKKKSERRSSARKPKPAA